MTWHLDSETGDVFHDQTLIGNAGEGPYLLEEDITAVVVADALPDETASVRGEHLQTVVELAREEMRFGTP